MMGWLSVLLMGIWPESVRLAWRTRRMGDVART
jgi:hypothetical protein